MKIDEFIEKVNAIEGVNVIEHSYDIYINSVECKTLVVPKKATNFFELIFLSSSYVSSFDKNTREFLSALIEEFLETPIKDRCFFEKKWHLNIGQDEYGNNIYLMNVVGSTKQLRTSLTVSNEFTTFTDSDLVRLKEQYPRLAPAIDAMKEEVKD